MNVNLSEVIDLLIEAEVLLGKEPKPTRQPTHGNCCTCQDCGHAHDECVCAHNSLLEALHALPDYEPLIVTWDEIFARAESGALSTQINPTETFIH
jgi:DTW domain-containing protein YfiP